MNNLAMANKLKTGECLDVLKEGVEVVPGLYKLARFVDDVDYCDATREWWIWSIGQHKETGEIFASTNTQFYQEDNYTCLFLR
jgi:hypothetical protein